MQSKTYEEPPRTSGIGYRLKKWTVDTASMAPFLFAFGFASNYVLPGFDVSRSLQATAYNAKWYPAIGPIMEIRDAYRRHIWQIKDETKVSTTRDKISNITWSMIMQGCFYVPGLIHSGEHNPAKIIAGVAMNMGLRSVLQAYTMFPTNRWVRKKFGVLPKAKRPNLEEIAQTPTVSVQ